MNPDTERIIIMLAALFAVAALLITAVSLFRRAQSQSINELWRVYLFEFVIVAAILLPAYLGAGYFLAVLLLFSLRAHFEVSKSAGLAFNAVFLSSYLFGSALLLTLVFHILDPLVVQLLLLLAAALASLVLHLAGHEHQRENWLLFIVHMSTTCLLALLDRDNGFMLILFLFVITESNDSFAYLFGKIFGRKKLFPFTSPQKTLEGLLGGIIASLLIGFLLNQYLMNIFWLSILLVTGAIIASAVAGDLLFSVYKRGLDMKDFPAVIGNHGGILDIYDSLLVASIVYYFLVLAFF